jgi:L-gulonate 5-dehydrogenase
MKAFVVTEPLKSKWTEIDEPGKPGSHQVIMKVKASGICGTDIHIWHGKHGAVTYPRIPGHELVGEVVAVGSGVSNVKVGDHVAVDPVVSCGECPTCKGGRSNICKDVKCLGVQTEGGFTDLITLDAKRVYSFDPSIAWDVAALVEPFSIAAQITDRLRINSQDKVLVIGGGTIGLCLLQTIQGIYGAEAIIADISPNKLRLATESGAKAAINSKEADPVDEAAKIWNQAGPTVIIDAVGHTKIMQSAFEKAIPGTRIGVIAFTPDALNLPPVDITKRELELIGSRMNNDKFPTVLEWFKDGKVDVSKLISHKFKFSEIEKAFQTVDSTPDEVCKMIVEF